MYNLQIIETGNVCQINIIKYTVLEETYISITNNILHTLLVMQTGAYSILQHKFYLKIIKLELKSIYELRLIK